LPFEWNPCRAAGPPAFRGRPASLPPAVRGGGSRGAGVPDRHGEEP